MGSSCERDQPPHRPFRLIVLFAGLVLPQAILFGPSMVGARVLLPLDLLGVYYLPNKAGEQHPAPHNLVLGDPVFAYESWRRFAAGELWAGRWPLWHPSIFLGTPF